MRAGDTIRVYEKIKEGDKERVQVFEGVLIARKHGSKTPDATFTVRKISHGVGVEKTFPLHSPIIEKIEIVKHEKVRRAKLYYLRDLTGKKKRRRTSKMLGLVYEEKREESAPSTAETVTEETSEKQIEEPKEEKK